MKLFTIPFKLMFWLSFPVALAAAILLLSPAALVDDLGMTTFVDEHRPVLGMVFVVADALAITGLIWLGIALCGKHVVRCRRNRCKQREQLAALSKEQRGYLLEFMKGSHVIEYMLVDGVAGALRQKDMIYINVKKCGMVSAPHRIRPWVRRLLKRQPGLLEGAVKRAEHPLHKTRC